MNTTAAVVVALRGRDLDDHERRGLLHLGGGLRRGGPGHADPPVGDELLRSKINGLVQAGQKRIVLNLGEVPYIDSAGLGEVVRSYTTVKKHEGVLKLLSLTKRIQDLLAITKLLTVFDTYDSETDSVKSFGA